MSCAPCKLLIVKLITCVSVWAAQYCDPYEAIPACDPYEAIPVL